jgi:hypothetical protein
MNHTLKHQYGFLLVVKMSVGATEGLLCEFFDKFEEGTHPKIVTLGCRVEGTEETTSLILKSTVDIGRLSHMMGQPIGAHIAFLRLGDSYLYPLGAFPDISALYNKMSDSKGKPIPS